jgi:hypothetical protein
MIRSAASCSIGLPQWVTRISPAGAPAARPAAICGLRTLWHGEGSWPASFIYRNRAFSASDVLSMAQWYFCSRLTL